MRQVVSSSLPNNGHPRKVELKAKPQQWYPTQAMSNASHKAQKGTRLEILCKINMPSQQQRAWNITWLLHTSNACWGVEEVSVQEFSIFKDIKHFFRKRNLSPFRENETARNETHCKGIWWVKYLFLLKCVAEVFKATVAWKEWRWSFLLLLLLLRVVKTKNSHILSLPFRGLLGLAYSSALIWK